MSELHDKARAILAQHVASGRWSGINDDIADTIRDLLAENERLTNALAAQVAATNGASAYAVEQAHRAEAAEAACANWRANK